MVGLAELGPPDENAEGPRPATQRLSGSPEGAVSSSLGRHNLLHMRRKSLADGDLVEAMSQGTGIYVEGDANRR
jgi:hypothetical protein